MTIERMDHVGVVVDDLEAATDFFVQLGLKVQGTATVEGPLVDRVIGLEGVRSEVAYLQTPDGHGALELSKFRAPPVHRDQGPGTSNTLGIRHVCFQVDDLDVVVAGLQARGEQLVGEVVQYENTYRLCYVHGPEGILVELAEQLG